MRQAFGPGLTYADLRAGLVTGRAGLPLEILMCRVFFVCQLS